MSPRITHANPKRLELGTSEQQMVLAEDGVGAKKPTDFGPVVSTLKLKISRSAPSLPVFARCQFASRGASRLSREGTWGQMRGVGQAVACGCPSACPSLCSTPYSADLPYIRDAEPVSSPRLTGREEGPGCACRCSGLEEGTAPSQCVLFSSPTPYSHPPSALLTHFFFFKPPKMTLEGLSRHLPNPGHLG